MDWRPRVNVLFRREGIPLERWDHYAQFMGQLFNRSEYYGEHSLRVAELCSKIARFYADDTINRQLLFLAGLLHDVGKAKISRELLGTTGGSLTRTEYLAIAQHVDHGYAMLHDRGEEFLAQVVLRHHRFQEHMYPSSLPPLPRVLRHASRHIEQYAALLSLADHYDSATTRPPRKMDTGKTVTERREAFLHTKHFQRDLILALEKEGIFNLDYFPTA